MNSPASDITTLDVHDTAQLAAAVNDCRQRKLPLVDYGVAHQGLGHPPPTAHCQLQRHGGIIDHYLRDLTVRAAAGITMGQLQSELVGSNQFVPIDADDDLTLGEVIDCNVYGPLRMAYGSIRDQLLGLHYLDTDANDIQVGGRTVKNVAGYDLTRFMVGGLGQFGVIHQATLRTYAIPQHVTSVDLTVGDIDKLDKLMPQWLTNDACPAHMTFGRTGDDWRISLAYFGSEAGCRVQLQALQLFHDEHAWLNITDTRESDFADDHHRRGEQRSWRRQASALVKIIVAPAMTARTCRTLAATSDQLGIQALPAHGCIWAGGDLDVSAAMQLDAAIRQLWSDQPGFAAWHRRPSMDLEPFAPLPPEMALLKQLKKTMDPIDLFNPGRLI